MSKNIEDKIEELLLKPVNDLGYNIYDVEYAKEGKEYFLRIFIDKPDGIDLNDCEKVSNLINPILDEADYIKQQYFLEVSSPGIERVLKKDKHFKNNIGNLVEVKLFKPINKEKTITGILKKCDNDYLNIETSNKDIVIDRKNIATAKTIYEW